MRPVVSVGLTLIDKTVCVITKNINNQRPLKMKNDVYIFVWADLPKMFGWAVIEPVWQVSSFRLEHSILIYSQTKRQISISKT